MNDSEINWADVIDLQAKSIDALRSMETATKDLFISTAIPLSLIAKHPGFKPEVKFLADQMLHQILSLGAEFTRLKTDMAKLYAGANQLCIMIDNDDIMKENW